MLRPAVLGAAVWPGARPNCQWRGGISPLHSLRGRAPGQTVTDDEELARPGSVEAELVALGVAHDDVAGAHTARLVALEPGGAEPDQLLALLDGDKELRQRLLDAAEQLEELEQAA